MTTMPSEPKKALIAFMIAFMLFALAVPQSRPVHAWGVVYDPANHVTSKAQLLNMVKQLAKDWKKNYLKYLGKIAMRQLARYIRMTILHAGPNGEPALVTNWRDFARNNQDAGANIGKMILGDAIWGPYGDTSQSVVCPAFRDALGQAVGARRPTADFSKNAYLYRIDSDQTFKQMSTCTLPLTVIVDGVAQPFDVNKFLDGSQFNLDIYQQILTNPANTFTGSLLLSIEQIEKQRAQQQGRGTIDATTGRGFLSITDANGNIKTPGGLVADAAGSIINSTLNCLNDVESWDQLTACAGDVLRNQIKNFANTFGGVVDGGDQGEPPPVQNPLPDQAECEKICVDMTNDSRDSCKDEEGKIDDACVQKLYSDCMNAID